MLKNGFTDSLCIPWGMKRGKDLQNYLRFSHQDQKLKYQHIFLMTPEPSLKDPENHRVVHFAAAGHKMMLLRTHMPNLHAQVLWSFHG